MFWRYCFALFYDLMIVLALWFLLTMLLVLYRGGSAIPPNTHWYQALLLLSAYLYYAGSLIKGGQTIGHKAWGLGVVFPKNTAPLKAVNRRLLYFWPAQGMALWRREKAVDVLWRYQAALVCRSSRAKVF